MWTASAVPHGRELSSLGERGQMQRRKEDFMIKSGQTGRGPGPYSFKDYVWGSSLYGQQGKKLGNDLTGGVV